MPEHNRQAVLGIDILGREEAYRRGFIDGYNHALERLKTLMYLAEHQIPMIVYFSAPKEAWAYLEGESKDA
jgi:hypothetical protein